MASGRYDLVTGGTVSGTGDTGYWRGHVVFGVNGRHERTRFISRRAQHGWTGSDAFMAHRPSSRRVRYIHCSVPYCKLLLLHFPLLRQFSFGIKVSKFYSKQSDDNANCNSVKPIQKPNKYLCVRGVKSIANTVQDSSLRERIGQFLGRTD